MKLLEVLHQIKISIFSTPLHGAAKKKGKKEKRIVMLFPYCMGKHPVLGAELPESKVQDWSEMVDKDRCSR